ncbi:glycosyltransferase family 4 protein [Methylophilus medardicus]|uniref:Glycosyltransferase family 4 protein n=1 Tax=Methylophilus medardicus TaxID=2588534 RepID=A0A5B8CQB0_9PROT|nr:glycosyltransferase family 4 protein [Methylophilus medardicus]QDC43444.1 glycosyltransferase family 4 protein [Methylophilus medardicus]QDC48451.1 glycosyltransferase family 4 protein [Methylophilus medardicus]QDC52156.1 glycosyltransferase family 4 protein [Methylophilus medardicus]
MKFAFLIFKYFPYGGVQRDMLRIAQDCVAQGHAVTIYTGAWRGDFPANINVKLLNAKGWLNHRRHQSLIKQMRQAVAAGGYDRVVGFNRMPGLDVYFAADPCYAERMHHEPWYKKRSGRYRFFSAMEHAVFGEQSATHILLLNQHDQAIFQRWYGTDSGRFHLIPPNVPLQRFSQLAPQDYRAYVRHTFQLPEDAIVLLTVGSAFVRKGVDRAIDALSNLPEKTRARCWLLAVGEFESSSDMPAYAHRRGVADRCIAAGGRPDIPALMLGCDVLVHAARSELAGIVLIEAMTAGLPLLVTAVCGYASYVQAAQAGEVLPEPFSQAVMNQRLAAMLDQLPTQTWSAQGQAFMQQLASTQIAQPEARIIASPAVGRPT